MPVETFSRVPRAAGQCQGFSSSQASWWGAGPSLYAICGENRQKAACGPPPTSQGGCLPARPPANKVQL